MDRSERQADVAAGVAAGPRLRKQLKVGARVVSHALDMGPEWPPEKTGRVDGRTIHDWDHPAGPRAGVVR